MIYPYSLIGHEGLWQGRADFNWRYHLTSVEGVLQAELTLGQLSANCSGTGICKVLPVGASASSCTSVRSTLVRHSPFRLDILFYRREACSCLDQHVFQRKSFVLNEVFVLPDWVTEKLQLPEGLCIADGTYPLTHFKDFSLGRFALVGI